MTELPLPHLWRPLHRALGTSRPLTRAITSFFTFYDEIYVPDHSAPLNRWVHFISNLSAIANCLAGLLLRSPDLFAFGVWCQLGPPYLGHILFEKTHKSIDQNWLFAAVGSWWTTFQILSGRQQVSQPPRKAAPVAPPPVSDEALLALLQAHGRNLHSFMVLEPGLSRWVSPEQDAAVAYADRGGHWVAVGSPLCAEARVVEVCRAFAAAARDVGKKATFFGVSQRFVDRIAGAPEFDALPIGQAPLWRPAAWSDSVKRSEKLRNRLRKAARTGVSVRRVAPDELAPGGPLRVAIERLVAEWVDRHALPPMDFMVTLELFSHLEARRVFVVEAAGSVTAVAVCVPIYGRNGWLVEDMMVALGAAAGTSEALVDAVMRALAVEGAEVVSLGMVVLAGLGGPAADRHPVLLWILRTSGRAMGWLYNFAGLYRFREKLHPVAWEGVYLVTAGPMSWLTLRAVLMAFAGGWVPRFAARALGWQLAHRVRR